MTHTGRCVEGAGRMDVVQPSIVNSQKMAHIAKCLRELKFAYLMYKDIDGLLRGDEESKKKIDEIFDKNWDFIYKTT